MSERVIKYHIAKRGIMEPEDVTVFEFAVGSTRADTVHINGNSFAYEIKTEYDKIDRFDRQMAEYSKVFEYVIAVVHVSHLQSIVAAIPQHIGIEAYDGVGDEIEFEVIKDPQLNRSISTPSQLEALSLSQLKSIAASHNVLPVPGSRSDCIDVLLRRCSPDELNRAFKEETKRKYRRQWSFVCAKIDRIYPIDIQGFFRAEVDPDWVYTTSSIDCR